MDKGEDTGVLQRDEARGRRAKEHCAADSAEGDEFPEADHRVVGRAGRGHTVVRVPSLTSVSAGRQNLVGSIGHGDSSKKNKKKQSNWWCAAFGGQYDWRNPNRVLVMQHSTDRSEAKVFRVHAPPTGVCENLICSLKLQANQHVGGDSNVEVVEGLQEHSKSRMDELRRFIVDNHEAVSLFAVASLGRITQKQRSAKEWKN